MTYKVGVKHNNDKILQIFRFRECVITVTFSCKRFTVADLSGNGC